MNYYLHLRGKLFSEMQISMQAKSINQIPRIDMSTPVLSISTNSSSPKSQKEIFPRPNPWDFLSGIGRLTVNNKSEVEVALTE